MKNIQRYDLDTCYSYGEYNKTISYGKRNSHLEGVNDYIAQLNNERKQYEQEMDKVINAEKDNENRKYHFWERWRKIKFISLGTFIGSFVLCVTTDGVGYSTLGNLLSILALFMSVITPMLFLIAIIMQAIGGGLYSRYVNNLRKQLDYTNISFDSKARTCYQAIDDIYLNSLDSVHRETVLMRREQNEHNQKMKELEEERNRLERENLEENRKIRNAQEQLLKIEQEREDRRLRW